MFAAFVCMFVTQNGIAPWNCYLQNNYLPVGIVIIYLGCSHVTCITSRACHSSIIKHRTDILSLALECANYDVFSPMFALRKLKDSTIASELFKVHDMLCGENIIW